MRALEPQSHVLDLIAGRWRSQAIHGGVHLGLFDALGGGARSATEVAASLGLDPAMTYRLMRALASLGLMRETVERRFTSTEAGLLLRRNDPRSLRDIVLIREGPEHTAVWKHLPAIVRDGVQNGFEREFGRPAFEYAAMTPSYAAAFDEGMSAYSHLQTDWTLEVLARRGLDGTRHVCDIGGGHGMLLARLLAAHPHLTGTVLERADALVDRDALWAERLGVGGRCRYIAGDMFADVPAADAYLLKMVLHNWSDEECVRILAAAARRAAPAARVFVVEHVIPGPDTPHFAKLFDLHMMTWGSGRERTTEEFASLLEAAGWRYVGTLEPAHGEVSVVEGERAPA